MKEICGHKQILEYRQSPTETEVLTAELDLYEDFSYQYIRMTFFDWISTLEAGSVISPLSSVWF